MTISNSLFDIGLKLFQLASLASASDWVQPNYYEARSMALRWGQKSQSGWGFPVGIKAAADWQMCPSLQPYPSGVASVSCDGSTCMQICEAGKVGMGKRRIRCRWRRKLGFFWKQQLSECQGCTPEIPSATDANVNFSCSLNSKGFNTCIATCLNGGKILGGRKLKMKCKCPRGVSTENQHNRDYSRPVDDFSVLI